MGLPRSRRFWKRPISRPAPRSWLQPPKSSLPRTQRAAKPPCNNPLAPCWRHRWQGPRRGQNPAIAPKGAAVSRASEERADGQRRVTRIQRHRDRGAARRQLSRHARQSTRDPRIHVGQDAQIPHPHGGRRSGRRGSLALRSHARTHQFPPERGTRARASTPPQFPAVAGRAACYSRAGVSKRSPRRSSCIRTEFAEHRHSRVEYVMSSPPERPPGSVDPKLLEILVCPLTKGPLEYDAEKQELISRSAKLAYPIRGGIPIMLPEEARRLD